MPNDAAGEHSRHVGFKDDVRTRVMKLTDSDRKILSLLTLLVSPTQEQITETLGIKRTAVAQSLLKLEKLGAVELRRVGKRHIPRLIMFVLLDQVQASIADVKGLLDTGPEA